ncbi:MAG TPA: dihydropteroate synthase [Fimbriimonadaceae bacterium]|nr:dihydropteroate synthase [Fimbriimonadaceae bacterium]
MPFALPKGRPALMGILNVTPDSFSDGGHFLNPERAIEHARQMVQDGADLIDVGGESTRPGAEEVPYEEELRRVLPVIQALTHEGIPVSIDTSKPIVAQSALEAGAVVVNDVTGFRNPEMISVCAPTDCTICIMHMQGSPRTMQASPKYRDVVHDVLHYLGDAIETCESAGIRARRIWIDPGFGFGKTLDHNLTLLSHLDRFCQTDYPVLVGVSRKSLIGKVLSTSEANDRLEGTLAAQAFAQVRGAKIIRAHDVKESRRVIDMISAIQEN